FLIARMIPLSGIHLLDIAIRSGLYVLLFAVLVLRLRVSGDLNDGYRLLREKLLLRKNKD
ncbi:MAG: hypothetical protein KDC61_05935, partial [Saprospiraceae bacterium]|nr:hypothetical protein [Saprospiraceae bacterium]